MVVAIRPEPHPTITIEDDGPGIREEDLPHLLDRFWRAPDAPAGGTELGLAIARWIAEHHAVESLHRTVPRSVARASR